LVLPATPPAARRVLRALTGAMPLIGRNLVAVGGDSMNINTVYRDADIAWSVRAVPVPVVFFTHQNPVAWDEPGVRSQGSGVRSQGAASAAAMPLLPPNGTDDVLLHAELVSLLVQAAYQIDGVDGPALGLLTNSDALAARLRGRRPAYFEATG